MTIILPWCWVVAVGNGDDDISNWGLQPQFFDAENCHHIGGSPRNFKLHLHFYIKKCAKNLPGIALKSLDVCSPVRLFLRGGRLRPLGLSDFEKLQGSHTPTPETDGHFLSKVWSEPRTLRLGVPTEPSGRTVNRAVFVKKKVWLIFDKWMKLPKIGGGDPRGATHPSSGQQDTPPFILKAGEW